MCINLNLVAVWLASMNILNIFYILYMIYEYIMIRIIWEHNGKYNKREKTELWETQNNDCKTVMNVTPKSI